MLGAEMMQLSILKNLLSGVEITVGAQLSDKVCHNFNRGVVVILSFLGIFLSGVLADVMVMLAVILWLWLPEFDVYLMHNKKLQQTIMLLGAALYLLCHVYHK